MQSNNTFDITRFGILWRQNLTHNYKLVLTSLAGFCGALFILLLLIQIGEGFHPLHTGHYFELLIVVFIATGIICSGTSFTNLRAREKMHNYLMLPASAFEKFLMEFIGRILLFILIVPLFYWAVFNLEGYLVHLFYPSYPFQSFPLFANPHFHFGTDLANNRMNAFMITGGLLIFIIPFTGATIFNKNPLIKTLFAVAIIFFFNLFLVYFFIEILEFKDYYPDSSILFMRGLEDSILALIIGSMIFNIALIMAAYFKLKEREV
ncbi:MAG: hypothetical protein WD824_10025 [Cyclobacteriaceae bacterium]